MQGVQSTVETAPNEAIHLCWKQSLINSVYLQNLVWTVEQIVNFIVSYLICMFQDSVPAGSYNDPFLSSVCVYHL